MSSPARVETQVAFCGLLPHPPIAIPEVGKHEAASCRATTRACQEFARRLVASRPDRVFLVSPHAPRVEEGFGLWQGTPLNGDLGAFGSSRTAIEVPHDEELTAALERAAEHEGARTWRISPRPLDHGAVVPLYFLVQAGWSGPTAVASLPRAPHALDLAAFGKALARALAEVDGRTALVASGDMSHRVLPGSPSGFHPRAASLDGRVRALVEARALDLIPKVDPTLRHLADEDAIDASAVLVPALPAEPRRTEVLSYEHPFGVGYLVAVFHDGGTRA